MVNNFVYFGNIATFLEFLVVKYYFFRLSPFFENWKSAFIITYFIIESNNKLILKLKIII